MDWPAAVLWPTLKVKWGPSAHAAAKATRLNVYALARLAGWREHAHRFALGPVSLTATFLPAHPRYWHPDGALVALGPVVEALGDALNRPTSAFEVATPFAVDLAPRLGIVIVRATPSADPPRD